MSFRTPHEWAIVREAARRAGIEEPQLGSDVRDYFAAAAAFEDAAHAWLREHPDEAREIHVETKERVEREHEERVAERLAEWERTCGEKAREALEAFLDRVGVGERTAESVMGSLGETQAITAAREWTKTEDAGALLLLGTKGTGKTVAAAWAMTQRASVPFRRCFCDSCQGGAQRAEDDCLVSVGHPARVRETFPNDRRALFVKAGHLASAVHRGDEALWDKAATVAVLVIDDLGREYADQHGRWISELDLLIDDRHEAKLRTIITSNLNGAEFKERYGERIADRIRQDGRIVVCAGESLRGGAR